MQEKALEKIKTEMEQNKDNAYIQVVGNYLIKFLNKNPGTAEKFLTEGKTIAKSLEAMRKEANKKTEDNFAMFTLEEGLEIVLIYFEIYGKPEATIPDPAAPAAAAPGTKTPADIVMPEIKIPDPPLLKDKVDFDVKLEDFLP